MSCNCGCHNDKPTATGWRKCVPLIVGVAIVAVLIAGALLKKNAAAKGREEPLTTQSAAAPRP